MDGAIGTVGFCTNAGFMVQAVRDPVNGAGSATSLGARPPRFGAAAAAACSRITFGSLSGASHPAHFIHIAKAGGTAFSTRLATSLGIADGKFSSCREPEMLRMLGNYSSVAEQHVKFVYQMGTTDTTVSTSCDLQQADLISAERTGTWKPGGAPAGLHLTVLRDPNCRVASHFDHHRKLKRRVPRNSKLEGYLESCCVPRSDKGTAPDCPLVCGQFLNFQTALLLGFPRAGLPAGFGQWSQLQPRSTRPQPTRRGCALLATGLDGTITTNKDAALAHEQILHAARQALCNLAFLGITERFEER